MESTRATVDRVRSVLNAMERSIDEARRRRLHRDDPAPTPPPPLHGSSGPNGSSTEPSEMPSDRPPQRLKARPKRATPLAGFDGAAWRSRAS